jgi:hypothetical protein
MPSPMEYSNFLLCPNAHEQTKQENAPTPNSAWKKRIPCHELQLVDKWISKTKMGFNPSIRPSVFWRG